MLMVRGAPGHRGSRESDQQAAPRPQPDCRDRLSASRGYLTSDTTGQLRGRPGCSREVKRLKYLP
jgi:hypothetical protein